MPFPRLVTCSQMQNFQHPRQFASVGNSWRWRSRIVNALGFSSCQSVLTSGVCIQMAATSLTMLRSARDLETNLLTSLCSYISAPPICLAPPASCAANMHNKEDLSADITNTSECGDDVRDRAPVRQGHVSVSPFTLFEVAFEPFACQLCFLSALTHGRFASSLCRCLCLCLFL